mmetsp:Transcript_98692/g.250487  ORF Transcript_98692/g.250487 Transcript_98692/m.250487 type:complete len:206 (-) Transcript_98692:156-773(-)
MLVPRAARMACCIGRPARYRVRRHPLRQCPGRTRPIHGKRPRGQRARGRRTGIALLAEPNQRRGQRGTRSQVRRGHTLCHVRGEGLQLFRHRVRISACGKLITFAFFAVVVLATTLIWLDEGGLVQSLGWKISSELLRVLASSQPLLGHGQTHHILFRLHEIRLLLGVCHLVLEDRVRRVLVVLIAVVEAHRPEIWPPCSRDVSA